MQNKFSEERVQSIMESLGGLQPAAAPDFFYTRLKGKMQPAAQTRTSFMLRPAFITTVLAVFLVVNIVSLINIGKTPQEPVSFRSNKPAGIESFAAAYNMNTATVYE